MRVLIVEDSKPLRESLRSGLVREGFADRIQQGSIQRNFGRRIVETLPCSFLAGDRWKLAHTAASWNLVPEDDENFVGLMP